LSIFPIVKYITLHFAIISAVIKVYRGFDESNPYISAMTSKSVLLKTKDACPKAKNGDSSIFHFILRNKKNRTLPILSIQLSF